MKTLPKRYPVADVLALVGTGKQVWDGYVVNMNSSRYRLFKKSCVCVRCGIEGTFFQLHQSGGPTSPPNKAHFNLWGERNGGKVLFTKDHIIPKSQGGPSHMDNYQTLCRPCNQRKADKMP